MKPVLPLENRTLIDQLLEDQRQLSAVEKFSRAHERHAIPAHQEFYRDLIPLTAPKPGEQFAFEVNLDACSGCKACVTACHSLNGLDDGETWRKTGLLLGPSVTKPFQQTITTACHHCVEPGCLHGCPVEAYEKDPVTGIVRHLDDQCIGCQYCVMTCPYEVPQYSATRGIVRKCDMCSSRLAVGEAPACVQACPNGAITIQIVGQATMREAARQNVFLPTAPDPALTIPTTRYVSARPLSQDVKSPNASPNLQPAHWPLVFMLVLTQASVGIFVAEFLWRSISSMPPGLSKGLGLAGLITGWLGLLASVLHLGRPLQAWRSFLGWKHSWLSREILAFGLFATLASVTTATMFVDAAPLWRNISAGLVCGAGLGAVFCSAMVYHATKREFWKLRFAALKFLGTALLLGCAGLWSGASLDATSVSPALAGSLMLISLLKLGWERSFFRVLDGEEQGTLQDSAGLMRNRFRIATGTRFLCGLVGGVVLPFLSVAGESSLMIPILGLTLCVTGELLERRLFFTAVAPAKMPGGF